MKQKLLNKLLTLALLTLGGVINPAWGDTTILTLDCATPAPTGTTSTALSNTSDVATFLNSAAGLSSAANKITCSAKSGDVYKGKGSGGGAIPQQCLKIGKASGGGGFTFTIPDTYDEIDVVELTCYGWKTTSSISLNSGTAQTFTTAQEQTTKTFELASSTRTISIAVTTSAVCVTKIDLYNSSGSTIYSVTYDGNGATSGDVPEDVNEYEEGDEVTVLGNTGSLAKTGYTFGGWNTQADGEGTNYSAGNTFSITANTTLYAKWNPYTITAQSNDNSYGAVSLDGYVITASPAAGYTYASPAYTISGSATVEQDGNAFTVTPSSDCTVTINFAAIPTHTATFSVNESTTSNTFYEGQAITFPSNPSDIAGRTFVGWVKTVIDGTTDEAPSFVDTASEEMVDDDIIYYAVFAIAEESGDPVETLTQTLAYDTWTYSGTTTDKGSYRMFGEDSYIESESFDLSKLSKVIIYAGTFGTISTKTISVKAGYITWGTTNTLTTKVHTTANEITSSTTLSGNGTIRIVPNDGDGSDNGFRISRVEIFIEEPSISYSAYCTTIIITKVETPVISPASGAVASGTMVTISCATDGATIYYTTDGTNPTTSSEEYSEAIEITSATTIKAIAVKDGLTDSEVASASYTIALPCATPTFSVAAGEVEKGTTVEISTETEDATIYYTTNGDTPTTSSTPYSSAITINTAQTVKAIAVKDGMLNSEVASVAYTVIDYTTLPFVWNGGTSSTLNALTGVTTYGLGSDYAAANAPYYQKMDGVGDYIQIKTNAKPGRVYVDVKMIGGGTQSKIKVQESANGTDFTDVEEFTIEGLQNAVLSFETTGIFNAASRYVRIIKSVHGSNIGVGPIKIIACESVTVSSAGYATYASDKALDFTDSNIKAYIAEPNGTTGVTFTQVNKIPAGAGVLLYKAGGATEEIPVTNESTDYMGANVFVRGTGEAVASVSGNLHNYILNNVGGVVGFYKAAGQTVATNRAYIQITEAAVKEFISLPGFDDEDPTGINSLTPALSEGEGAIYNLAGQRISKMQKGINIVNGKKVLF